MRFLGFDSGWRTGALLLRLKARLDKFPPARVSAGRPCPLSARNGPARGARLHVVVHVERSGERRVISARKANSREVALHERATHSSDR
jgi:hypothetical protein